uniref:Uncharacterized protein n=1 Tax=uncultured marine virus TaxID=186617 RepID=A0A0F7L7M0_9VIRU|nr:hypothetical protein [uncultured marine virus]
MQVRAVIGCSTLIKTVGFSRILLAGVNQLQNNMQYIIVYAIIHFTCTFLSYGIEFAYWQKEYPTLAKEKYKKDRKDALGTAILVGPIALLVTLYLFGIKHGFKIK